MKLHQTFSCFSVPLSLSLSLFLSLSLVFFPPFLLFFFVPTIFFRPFFHAFCSTGFPTEKERQGTREIAERYRIDDTDAVRVCLVSFRWEMCTLITKGIGVEERLMIIFIAMGFK